ncbi:hypothetical protein [Ruegeria sp. HKCCD7221]|uniref:hypothetical protein n=1 Tax=Ruegeria sp. HKCCD7221 TaxID=2683009 RepID=UPI001488794A|nr:hypothetical protein [Ruegeria sp. HKCCD7221]
MKSNELHRQLKILQLNFHKIGRNEQVQLVQLLIHTANHCIQNLREELSEEDAAAKRRKAKRKETELDPKPPLRPITVAEPSKPKKPKYTGLKTGR